MADPIYSVARHREQRLVTFTANIIKGKLFIIYFLAKVAIVTCSEGLCRLRENMSTSIIRQWQ